MKKAQPDKFKKHLAQLPKYEAPNSLWTKIEKVLDTPHKGRRIANMPQVNTTRWKLGIAAAVVLLFAFSYYLFIPSHVNPEGENFEKIIKEKVTPEEVQKRLVPLSSEIEEKAAWLDTLNRFRNDREEELKRKWELLKQAKPREGENEKMKTWKKERDAFLSDLDNKE